MATVRVWRAGAGPVPPFFPVEGASGWGRGRDGGGGAVERSGVTALPALRVQSNSACG